MTESKMINAPWTDEQIESLRAYQECTYVHAFTGPSGMDLMPTREGWIEYTDGHVVQTWAHSWMLDWTWKEMFAPPDRFAPPDAPWDEEDQALAMASGAPTQFAYLRRNSVRRCEESFFPLDHWSVTDWACALAGEVGEACNEAKKIKRGDGSVEALAKELADVVCYADLFAASQGIDLWKAVVEKFNEVSDRYGSPIKMKIDP